MDDLAAVWSWPAALFALGVGLGFGYVVIARVTLSPRWRTQNTARAYGWLVGVLGAWFSFVVVLSQVIASLITNDPLWPRVLSRYVMWLVASLGLGLGVWLRLRRKGPRTVTINGGAE